MQLHEVFSECFRYSLTGESPHKIFTFIMDHIVSIIPIIKYGIIGETMLNEEGREFIRYHTVYGLEKHPKYIKNYLKDGYVDFITNNNNNTLHLKALLTRNAVICENFAEEYSGHVLPPGHPKIYNFAAYPLIHKEESIGMIGLSVIDKYPEDFSETIAPFVELTTNILVAHQKSVDLENHKNSFMANMSHELRTPLNGVACMAKLLDKTTLNAEQEEYLNIINHCTIQLLDIINDILDYSKIKSGSLKLHIRPVSLYNCIGSVITIMKPKAADKGLILNYTASSEVPDMIIADNTRISQILLNVISNAVKFTRKGQIDVTVQVADKTDDMCELYFCIKDTGIGIPEEKKMHVFDSFRQINTNYLTDAGVGLGLPITQHLVNMFDGKIWIDSKPGEGTLVHIIFKVKLFDNAIPIQKLKEYFLGKSVLVILKENSPGRKLIFKSLINFCIRPIVVTSFENANMYIDNSSAFNFEFVIIDYRLYMTEFMAGKAPNLKSSLFAIIDDEHVSPVIFKGQIQRPIDDEKLTKVYNTIYVSNKYLNNDNLGVTETQRDNVNILVVEDNESNRVVIIKQLNSLGYYNIHVSHDGLDAYIKLCNDTPQYDIAFVDLKMPIMDGITAVKKFKESSKRDTMLVAVTASISNDIKTKCYDVGMHGYIEKPIDINELEAMINITIKQKQISHGLLY